jgi:DNA-directed RNA polymerase subunit RPC12/RpoP
MFIATCPECDAEIPFSAIPKLRQHVRCEKCQSILLVTELSPIHLDWAFMDPFEKPDSLGEARSVLSRKNGEPA